MTLEMAPHIPLGLLATPMLRVLFEDDSFDVGPQEPRLRERSSSRPRGLLIGEVVELVRHTVSPRKNSGTNGPWFALLDREVRPHRQDGRLPCSDGFTPHGFPYNQQTIVAVVPHRRHCANGALERPLPGCPFPITEASIG